MRGLGLGISRQQSIGLVRSGFVAEESVTYTHGVAYLTEIISLSGSGISLVSGSSNIEEILSLSGTTPITEHLSSSDISVVNWDPSRLSSLRGWYESDVGYGGGSWLDQSGISNDLTLTGTSVGSTLNTHPTVNFNGTSDQADRTTFSMGAEGAITLFCVAKITATTLAQQSLAIYGDGVLDNHGVGSVIAGTAIGISGTAVYTGSSSLVGSWHRVGITDLSGGSMSLYVNGSVETTGDNFGHIHDNLHLAVGHYPVANLFGKCDIAEIVVCNTVLSGADLTRLDTYFTSKYNL